MTLYKNVDLKDLQSILKDGLLSIDESGNYNWDNGKRAENPTDCVYLFEPVEGKENSFPKSYGVVLLEVDVEDAMQVDFVSKDVHESDYKEYIVKRVAPQDIKRVLVPEFLKDFVSLPEELKKVIEWCGFSATHYVDFNRITADEAFLFQFAKTAEIHSSAAYNFFRGENEKGETEDLYDIHYLFPKRGLQDTDEKKTTKAQRKAVKTYDEKFERVNCRFATGTKKRIQKLGYQSINSFIKLAVSEKLEREEKILR
jgi:hypothetical protein